MSTFLPLKIFLHLSQSRASLELNPLYRKSSSTLSLHLSLGRLFLLPTITIYYIYIYQLPTYSSLLLTIPPQPQLSVPIWPYLWCIRSWSYHATWPPQHLNLRHLHSSHCWSYHHILQLSFALVCHIGFTHLFPVYASAYYSMLYLIVQSTTPLDNRHEGLKLIYRC